MSSHRLLLRAGPRQLENLNVADFLWRGRGDSSSMETSISPRLEELGPVPALHIDFVRLAVLVFLADRSSLRTRGKGIRWDRELDLVVPVSDPEAWNDAAVELEAHLRALTGDSWTVSFEKERPPKKRNVVGRAEAPVVCLFSGGADSLGGALLAKAQTGVAPVLVSHWDFPAMSAVQSRLVSNLQELWDEEVEHHQIELMRRKHQIGSGEDFPNEQSRRSRSLLFLALGLAVAAVRHAELWMSENGFTSINPPLSPERRGSLTTRTTHPGFLDGLSETLRSLGLEVRLRNPFQETTKGEVLRGAAKNLSAGVAKDLFSASHSCGKPPWFRGYGQGDHCGLCFGCLVRRGSFIAGGIDDETLYIEEDLRGDSRRDAFVTATRMKTVQAVRYRLGRGYDERELLSMALPDRIPVDEALALVRSGLEELRPVIEDIP